jgi:hypothetical protein
VDRNKIVVPDQREYDTSFSSDPEEARRTIEQARQRTDPGGNGQG